MLLVIGIIWFVIVLVADLYSDYEKWLNQRTVQHTLEAWERAVVLLPSVVFIPFHFHVEPWKYVLFGFVEAFTYWFLFDGIYNKIRGFNWWFFGSFGDPGGDAKLDVFQKNLGITGAKIFKIGGIIITLTLFILL